MPQPTVRAAIYLRISLDREMDGLAIDRQRADCVEIANSRGWTISNEYVDQSMSATDKAKRRPAYDQLVDDFTAKRFDAIICWDLDRLTRQPRQLEDWIDAAEERGLRLVTANGEADLTTDGGRLFARVKAAVARSEVERKTARQSAAQAQRAAQGRVPKGMRPLGYTVAGDVVPHEAAAVHAMYTAFNNGTSLRAIAAALSGEKGERVPMTVPALPRHTRTVAIERNARRSADNRALSSEKQLRLRPVPENAPWPPSTVLGILRNPRYAGSSTYTPREDPSGSGRRRALRAAILRDEAGEPIRGQWDATVDEGLWAAVQERLDSPDRIANRVGTDRRHLGSGLYRCGICGERVRAHTSRYRCVGHITRSREQIDVFVTHAIRARLSRRDLVDLLPSRDEPRLEAIKVELGAHRARISRAQRDYDAEVIEGKDLKRVRDREEMAIAVLDAERVRLSASASAGAVLGSTEPAAAFEAADLAAKRSVIDALCDVVLHSHPRGVRTFNPSSVEIRWRE
jgi:site-specific DNA recombinase